MTDEERAVIAYRLGRAREAIEEAAVLLESGHVNTYVNRLYYACYYAVSGLLLRDKVSTTRHTHVRALLHQKYVKPGRLPVAMGQHFDRLFDSRQKGDYADFIQFKGKEVADWLEVTRSFVDAIEAALEEDSGGTRD